MAERVVYGKRAVIEALEAGLPVRRVHLAARSHAGRDGELLAAIGRAGVRPNEAPRELLDRLSEGGRHQGVLAVFESRAFLSLGELLSRARKREIYPVLLAMDRITDPRNLGALLRSAEALGAAGAFFPERRNAPLNAAAEKAAAGATAHLDIAQVVNLSDALAKAKDEGFWAVGADADGGEPIYRFDFKRPTVLVIGSEGKGLGERVRKNCDALVTIPLKGKVASLNASVASGIVLYEIFRQRLMGA